MGYCGCGTSKAKLLWGLLISFVVLAAVMEVIFWTEAQDCVICREGVEIEGDAIDVSINIDDVDALKSCRKLTEWDSDFEFSVDDDGGNAGGASGVGENEADAELEDFEAPEGFGGWEHPWDFDSDDDLCAAPLWQCPEISAGFFYQTSEKIALKKFEYLWLRVPTCTLSF